MSDMAGEAARVAVERVGTSEIQKLEPLREPRRASLFTISALQIGQCGTVSDESVLAADFCAWRLSRAERMTRMRPRSAFSLSQYKGIPTTKMRIATKTNTGTIFAVKAWKI